MNNIVYQGIYRFLKMNLEEFILYLKENEDRFLRYCEIVIDKEGNIYLPVYAGHIFILAYLAQEENKEFTDEKLETAEIELLLAESKAISIWYEFQFISTRTQITEEQNSVMKYLIDNNFILEKIIKKEFRII